MSFPEQLFEANYTRAYGQHDFVTAGGEVVSVLSEPTWENFYGRLESSAQLGEFVLSPELITFTTGLEDIPARQADIEGRIADVRELSRRRPDSTIILGTATFNNPSGRPANSLLFIAGGDVVAQANKGFSFYPPEKRVFTLRQATAARTTNHKLAGLVCSDILGEGDVSRFSIDLLLEGSDEPEPGQKITAATEIVLLSTCWAVPVVEIIDGPSAGRQNRFAAMAASIETAPASHEDRFRRRLEGRIGLLFRSYPALREVIVADRLMADTEVEAPYNGHFTRREA
ncbi:MAG TPA: hypothetical protein VII55_03425 [Candidatus Saccharimonadales bacterium]